MIQLLFLSIVTFFIATLGFTETLVDRLQEFYSQLKDAEGSFIQKSYMKELDKTVIYRGKFYLKQGRMFLDYRGDKPQKVYISDSTLIIYHVANKTAFKMPFDDSRYGQTPVMLIRGLADIRSEFEIKTKGESTLLLRPNKAMSNVVRIDLRLTKDDGFPIESFTMVDKVGNTTEVILNNVRFNSGISDKVFRFNPPPDTTVIEN